VGLTDPRRAPSSTSAPAQTRRSALRAARRPILLTAALATLGGAIGGVLSGCDRFPGKPVFKAIDLSGADYARRLDLPDAQGQARSLEDFRGKLVFVFFGYTQCPDVCPTTMSTMAEVMKQLGQQADRVQVIFVTVDPERDTPEILREYVGSFDPRFIALRGTGEAFDRVRKEFRLVVQKNKGATPSTYTVDHTAAAYVLDAQGRPRLYVRHETPAADIAADLRTLLGS
jgi:protein SCO1/2